MQRLAFALFSAFFALTLLLNPLTAAPSTPVQASMSDACKLVCGTEGCMWRCDAISE